MELHQRSLILRAVLPSVLAAALLVAVGIWARHAGVTPGQVPILAARDRWFWVFGLLVAIATGAGFQAAGRSSPPELDAGRAFTDRPGARSRPPSTAWMLPFVISLTTVMLLAVYHQPLAIVGLALAAMIALAVSSAARDELRSGNEVDRQRARNLYTLLIHLIAFVALSMIYINKLRSLFSATAVLALVCLLLYQLTEGEDVAPASRLVYAISGGLVLGEITWVLNYWRATGWTGGAALLIFFYFLAGLIQNHLRGGVTARDLAEYGGVSAVAFAIVAVAVLR